MMFGFMPDWIFVDPPMTSVYFTPPEVVEFVKGTQMTIGKDRRAGGRPAKDLTNA